MCKLYKILSHFFIALFLLSNSQVFAQVPGTAAGYAFLAYPGTYTPIVGGTSISIIGDDVNVQNIPIGFTFPFAGGTYTTVTANSNGWLAMGNKAPSAAQSRGNTTTNANIIAPMVMALWDDLNGSPSGQAFYQTSGTAPNRVLTVEWRSWKWIWTGSGNNVISYQVKLYEPGRIEIIYSQGPDAVNATASATIGIAKSNTDYQTVSSVTTHTISTTSFIDNISTKPPTGQVYSWDIPCSTPGGVMATNVTNKSASVSWNTVTGSLGYEYVLNQSPAPPSFGTNGTAISATSLNFSGLLSGTTYYFHLRNKCSANFSSWVTVSFTTQGCFSPTNLLIKNVSDTSASMLWSQMPDADYYQYALSFSNQPPVTGIVNTNSITNTFNGLTPNSKYYFFLRSRCFGEDSSSWKRDSFVTLINCYPPVVKVNLLGTNEPYAFWDPVPTAFAYEYVVSSSPTPPAFGNTIFNTFQNIKLEDDGKDYYLHVRTKCNGMYTYSSWHTTALRKGGTDVKDVNAERASIYPNPVKNALFIKGPGNGRYTILDMAGRIITEGTITSPASAIDITFLSPAVYLIKIESTGQQQVLRFTKQ